MKLAQKAGLHLKAIAQLERGETGPNLTTVFALAKAMRMRPTQLIAKVQRLNSRTNKK